VPSSDLIPVNTSIDLGLPKCGMEFADLSREFMLGICPLSLLSGCSWPRIFWSRSDLFVAATLGSRMGAPRRRANPHGLNTAHVNPCRCQGHLHEPRRLHPSFELSSQETSWAGHRPHLHHVRFEQGVNGFLFAESSCHTAQEDAGRIRNLLRRFGKPTNETPLHFKFNVKLPAVSARPDPSGPLTFPPLA
jgi:hypothetical protein